MSEIGAPRVSVVIPTHNHAAYVARAIESVLQQSFDDLHLFVVDDGSTDNTRAIVSTFTADARFHYLYQTNRERAAARNLGINASQSEYVAVLDADDWWHPDKLARQVSFMEGRPDVGLTHTRAWQGGKDSIILPKVGQETRVCDRFADLLLSNPIVCSSVVLRRTCLDRVGLFDEQLPVFGAEDWDMWLRVSRRYVIARIDEPLVYYRVHISNTSRLQVFQSYKAVLDKTFVDPTLPAEIMGLKRRAYSRYHINMGLSYHQLGRNADVRHHLLKAMALYPLNLRYLGLTRLLLWSLLPWQLTAGRVA